MMHVNADPLASQPVYIYLRIGEGVVETVSREDGGLTVDVVQCYLDGGECTDRGIVAAKR